MVVVVVRVVLREFLSRLGTRSIAVDGGGDDGGGNGADGTGGP